jgi:hypothetical protein
LNISRPLVWAVAVSAAALSFVSCGGGTNPVGANTPTPTPAPTAEPTPTPFVCPLGADYNKVDINCAITKKADSVTFNAVKTAVDETVAENPTWFWRDESNRARVFGVNRQQFFLSIVDKLNARGFCSFDDAHGHPGDGLEIAVKRVNEFSEQYKPWVTGCPSCGLDDGIVRTDASMHVATCEPASF